MSKSDSKADDKVGYRKPPVEHRFKKGQSGNPKGRPRKAKTEPKPPKFRDALMDGLVEAEAFRTLQLRENGQLTQMPAAQAVLRSIFADGVKGNRLAKKFAFQLLEQKERDELKQASEVYEYYARKKAEGQAEIERCRNEGRPPPRLYPHPDDILLDEAKIEVHILGPSSADRAIPYERGAVIRDWFLARWIFEEKCGKETMMEWEGQTYPIANTIAFVIDYSLPPSLKRDDPSMLCLIGELHRMTKRQLRQRMRDLMTQIAEFPETIDEQLATRKRSAQAMSLISEGFEKAAIEIAERKEGS